MTSDAALFGRGLAFPPRLDADGRVAWSAGPANIRDAIRVVLMTDPGERVMLPAFGAGLRSFLSEPNVAATHRLIEQRIVHALERWEPRIDVGAVRVRASEHEPQQAVVTVEYVLVAARAPDQVTTTVRLAG